MQLRGRFLPGRKSHLCLCKGGEKGTDLTRSLLPGCEVPYVPRAPQCLHKRAAGRWADGLSPGLPREKQGPAGLSCTGRAGISAPSAPVAFFTRVFPLLCQKKAGPGWKPSLLWLSRCPASRETEQSLWQCGGRDGKEQTAGVGELFSTKSCCLQFDQLCEIEFLDCTGSGRTQ